MFKVGDKVRFKRYYAEIIKIEGNVCTIKLQNRSLIQKEKQVDLERLRKADNMPGIGDLVSHDFRLARIAEIDKNNPGECLLRFLKTEVGYESEEDWVNVDYITKVNYKTLISKVKKFINF